MTSKKRGHEYNNKQNTIVHDGCDAHQTRDSSQFSPRRGGKDLKGKVTFKELFSKKGMGKKEKVRRKMGNALQAK